MPKNNSTKSGKKKLQLYPKNTFENLSVKDLLKEHPLSKKDKGRGRAILEKFTIEQIAEKCAVYFEECIEYRRPFIMTGLANVLDSDRETILKYAEGDDALAVILKKATKLVFEYWEAKLNGSQVTGAIFWLKNHKWNGDTNPDGISSFKIDKIEITVKNGNIKTDSNNQTGGSPGNTTESAD
jgi:hypothetical protein